MSTSSPPHRPGRYRRGRFRPQHEPPAQGERFELLAELDRVHIERIHSSLHPDTKLYVQDHDEWVALLEGTAVIEIEGEQVELAAGEFLFLPRGVPHRVLRTSHGALWLALHGPRVLHDAESRDTESGDTGPIDREGC